MTDADDTAPDIIDIDAAAAPNGTKRRGSTEIKAPEEDTNLVAPNIETELLSISDEEPVPQPSATKTETIKSYTRSSGHRRRNTDGAVTGFLTQATSNAAVIRLMQQELPPSARLAMQKKGQGLKLERELKHLQIKLRESQDQCNTAVEIIGKLEEEKEDLLSVNDTLRTQLGAAQTEVKILDQKTKSLEEAYRDDTQKFREEVDDTKKQLSDLTDNINQKDMALNQAKAYQKKLQQRLNADDADGTGTISSSGEKRLLQQLRTEQAKVLDKNRKIDELMLQLGAAMRAEHEKEGLQKEIDSFAQMAQEDLMQQEQQIKKMTSEIIMLGSRNSALDKERDDLMLLLEERDYENQMLKTGYGLHRSKTTANVHNIADQLTGGDDDFDDTLNLEFMANSNSNKPMYGDDIEQYDQSDEYDTESPTNKKLSPRKEVADVTREYLHLTASVVNMKFPRVQHIASEELINKVKNYQFWEYHDMMVRIMKTEEQKMLAKEKAEKEEKTPSAKAQSGGMLGRFRNFFGQKNTTGKDRKPMVNPATNKFNAVKTRYRNKSATDSQQSQRMEEAKKKINQVGKKAKDFKDTTVKKITSKPSEEESAKMADMSFKSVPELGGYAQVTQGKVKKPDQGL